MQIKSLIARRPDLSTFVVHLTRDSDGVRAVDKLRSILQNRTIEARTAMGMAAAKLTERDPNHPGLASQKVVCFTETPLEHLYLLQERIDDLDRICQFQSYGIALTKRVARKKSVNP